MRRLTRHPFAAFLLCLTMAGLVEGQPPGPGKLPQGAKLYIAPMEWKLDEAIAGEIGRQGLPVQVVPNQQDASFVMTGVYQNLGSRTTSPGHFIQVKIVQTDGGKQVWGTEVRDFGVVFAQLQPHGRLRAARTIVRRLAGGDQRARRTASR